MVKAGKSHRHVIFRTGHSRRKVCHILQLAEFLRNEKPHRLADPHNAPAHLVLRLVHSFLQFSFVYKLHLHSVFPFKPSSSPPCSGH